MDERRFATSFPDFWRRLLPLLTPSRVHLLHATYERRLLDEDDLPVGLVPGNPETRDAAIVSEFAFHLAGEATSRGIPVRQAYDDVPTRQRAQTAASNLISRYEGRAVVPDARLNSDELEEGLRLASRYESFAEIYGGLAQCTFRPPIPGSGFLDACAADLIVRDDFLVEVKTVKRAVASKDIHQLITYLALGSTSPRYSWRYAGFFNPRRGTFHRLEIGELIGLASGGRPAVDVYEDLLEFTCSSDVEMDGAF